METIVRHLYAHAKQTDRCAASLAFVLLRYLEPRSEMPALRGQQGAITGGR
jgi:hypothetical protein